MLSLKKKTDSAAIQVPPWHPNFRNYQQLPDIKVVRTAFFVNGTAAFIALGLLVVTVRREFEIRSTTSNLQQSEALIAADKPESDKAIADYTKFKEQEKRVKDVEAFVKSKPVMSEIVLRLGEIRPKNIVLDSVDIRAAENQVPTIQLRGTARGSAVDQAYSELNSYVDLLRADPKLGPKFDPGAEGVKLANSAPDTAKAIVKFEIAIKFKPATPTPPPAAAATPAAAAKK